jgi:hypothetical protein
MLWPYKEYREHYYNITSSLKEMQWWSMIKGVLHKNINKKWHFIIMRSKSIESNTRDK